MPKLRRFLVLDLLTLTTATALGIAGARKVWKSWAYAWFWHLDRGWSACATLDRVNTAMAILTPVLAAWTAAVLASRFVPPRPRLRRIALQPGSAACGAALLVIAAETVAQAASRAVFEASKGYFGLSWSTAGGFASWFHSEVLLTVASPISFAVIASWSVLFLSRRARPEPSWVDRSGRILGACWIAFALVSWFNHDILEGRLPGSLSHRGPAESIARPRARVVKEDQPHRKSAPLMPESKVRSLRGAEGTDLGTLLVSRSVRLAFWKWPVGLQVSTSCVPVSMLR